MSRSESNSMLAAAVALAADGMHIFPVHGVRNARCTCDNSGCSSPGKHPRIKDWETLATTDARTIQRWFEQWPTANIGWALGPNGFAAVDVDPRNGGFDSFARLEQVLGPLNTRRQITGGDGLHHICLLPCDVKLRSRKGAFGGSYPGIDLKSSGGLIVLAPSLHVSGNRYAWDGGSLQEFAELPMAWIEALHSSRATGNRVPFEVPEQIRDGERHRILHRLASSFRDKGANAAEMLAMFRAVNAGRCDPPLDDSELQELARDTERRYKPSRNLFVPLLQEERETMTWCFESAAQITRRGVPLATWDIEGLLPDEDGPAILFGPPGSLKTWIAAHAAACAVTGNPFLGHFAVRRRPYALYVNLDAGPRAFERRVLKLGFAVENLLIVSPDGFNTAALREALEKHPEAFVVIDTMADAFSLQRGEDQAEAMRQFLRSLRALFQEYGAGGFIIDHPHRPRDGASQGDYYGSIQKEAAARIMWHVTPLASAEKHVLRSKITCRKMSEEELFAPLVARLDFTGELVVATYDGGVSDTGPFIDISAASDIERVVQMLRGVPGGASCGVIQRRTGLSRDRVLAAVKASFFVAMGKGPARRYVLAETYAPPDDSPDDFGRYENNRAQSSESPGYRTDPNDPDGVSDGSES